MKKIRRGPLRTEGMLVLSLCQFPYRALQRSTNVTFIFSLNFHQLQNDGESRSPGRNYTTLGILMSRKEREMLGIQDLGVRLAFHGVFHQVLDDRRPSRQVEGLGRDSLLTGWRPLLPLQPTLQRQAHETNQAIFRVTPCHVI